MMINDDYAYIFIAGVVLGVIACIVIMGFFGVFEPCDIVLCEDISLMSGYETRILDDACELNIDGYWITYDNYIEHLR